MRFGLKIARLGLLGAATIGMLAAGPAQAAGDSARDRAFKAAAKIVPAARPLQCVPFARRLSGVPIRGDAWTWWRAAEGRYERGQRPSLGAVLVMKKTDRLGRGHLAVVTRIVDRRTIVVDQANWLNRGRIHLNTAVRDVSPGNDWSAVRVWYTPGARFGSASYAARGFIYPPTPRLLSAGVRPVPLPPRRPGTIEFVKARPQAARPATHPAAARGGAGDKVKPGTKSGPEAAPARPARRRTGHENLARDIAYLG